MRSNYGARHVTIADAQSYLLPALVLCGCPDSLALELTEAICAKNPDAAIKISGFLARGETVPPELIALVKP
jgi:hypothetical protein